MKRFVDTEMMLRPWFRNLKPRLKCLWLWMITRCDMAGVLDMDWDLVSFTVGDKVTPADLQQMNGNAIAISGEKILLPGFVNFQYGELNEKSPVHRGVLKVLSQHGIQYPFDTLLEEKNTLSGVSNTPKDKDKDKDKAKDKDKPFTKKGGVVLPFKSEAFKDAWRSFLEHRAKLRSPMTDRAQELNLKRLPESEAAAIRWVNTAIERGWKGIFEPQPDASKPGPARQNYVPQFTQKLANHYQDPIPDETMRKAF